MDSKIPKKESSNVFDANEIANAITVALIAELDTREAEKLKGDDKPNIAKALTTLKTFCNDLDGVSEPRNNAENAQHIPTKASLQDHEVPSTSGSTPVPQLPHQPGFSIPLNEPCPPTNPDAGILTNEFVNVPPHFNPWLPNGPIPGPCTNDFNINMMKVMQMQAMQAQTTAAAQQVYAQSSAMPFPLMPGIQPNFGIPRVPDDLMRNAKFTTVMVMNVPLDYTQDMFMEEVHSGGYRHQFDFLYLPILNDQTLGYAFVNFLSTDLAESFQREYEGYPFSWSKLDAHFVVRRSQIQGFAAITDHFMNAPSSSRPAFLPNGQWSQSLQSIQNYYEAKKAEGQNGSGPDPRPRGPSFGDFGGDPRLTGKHSYRHGADPRQRKADPDQRDADPRRRQADSDQRGANPRQRKADSDQRGAHTRQRKADSDQRGGQPDRNRIRARKTDNDETRTARAENIVPEDFEGPNAITTLMVRNVPESYTQSTIVDLLNELGLGYDYDFLYLPQNPRKRSTFFFINLKTAEKAHEAFRLLQERPYPHEKGIRTFKAVAASIQGLAAMKKHFHGTKAMKLNPTQRPFFLEE